MRLTVQAKILHYLGKESALWLYDELAHPPKKPGDQAADLVRYARREQAAGRLCYPYYVMYNPSSVGSLQTLFCCVDGAVTMIDGFAANAFIQSRKGPPGTRFPVHEKRHSALRPLMISMMQLFCTGSKGIPTPESVKQTIEWAWPIDQLRFMDLRRVSRIKPKLVYDLPQEVRLLLEATRLEFEEVEPIVARDTVLFVSGDD